MRRVIRRVGNLDIDMTWVPGIVLACIFWAASVFSAVSNIYQVATYRPVQVQVQHTEIARIEHQRRNRVTYSYEPIVEYAYAVDGNTYTSRRVTPLGESHSREWAEEVIHRYDVGEVYTGYYNPINPSDAYLMKRYDAGPYCLILPMALLIVLFGAAALLSSGSEPTAPAPILQSDGWYAVGLPPAPPRWPIWAILAVVWYGLGIVSVGPYFLVAFPDYDGFLVTAIIVYVFVGAGLVYMFATKPPAPYEPVAIRLYTASDQLVRGTEIATRVEVLADTDLAIDNVLIGLVPGHVPPAGVEPPTPASWIRVAEHQRVEAGQSLSWVHPLALPDKKDEYNWQIVVRVRVEGKHYTKAFGIFVQSPPLFAPRLAGS